MIIQLEVLYDSPLSIAEALIQREMMRCNDDCSAQLAKENTWQMGMALLNHAESCKRIDQWGEMSKEKVTMPEYESFKDALDAMTDCHFK